MDGQQLTATVADALHSLAQELTSARLLIQFGLILLAAVIGTIAASLIRRRIDLTVLGARWPQLVQKLARMLLANLATIIFVLLLDVMRAVMMAITWPSASYLLGVAASLATAWVLIAVVTGLIRNQFVYRLVAISAWTIAALSILGYLDSTVAALNSVGITLGGLRVTPLLVIKTSVLLMLTLWAANAVADFLDRRLQTSTDLTPSIQVLMSKLIRLLLISFAVVIVLSTVGIDLSALAFFSGAVGVGVGFGLQKIVSNLVSGIILLADKSIKPGDVISVGDHFGRVGNMGARYTSVDTRDGREYLIPNEDFITQRVANWTYSSDLVRLFVKFSTTYDSDPRKAQEAAVEAALNVERVLKKPAPACMLTAFGATSIEYELWFWIRDPAAGVVNVKSDVLLALWDTLDKQGVSIPKPGPARVIYELAHEDEPGAPQDQSDAPAPRKSPFPG
ncbi:MAG TPA: mechanosensitive ion channel domain-containing protein [Pseudolabrys sp.]